MLNANEYIFVPFLAGVKHFYPKRSKKTTYNNLFACLFSILNEPAYFYLAHYVLLFHGEIMMYVTSDRNT